jgi:hypothetical protein
MRNSSAATSSPLFSPDADAGDDDEHNTLRLKPAVANPECVEWTGIGMTRPGRTPASSLPSPLGDDEETCHDRGANDEYGG